MTELLHEWVTQQANQTPEAVALVMGQESMTYGELDQSSNQLARTLKDRGCKQGDRICLLLPKSPAAIVGIRRPAAQNYRGQRKQMDFGRRWSCTVAGRDSRSREV